MTAPEEARDAACHAGASEPSREGVKAKRGLEQVAVVELSRGSLEAIVTAIAEQIAPFLGEGLHGRPMSRAGLPLETPAIIDSSARKLGSCHAVVLSAAATSGSGGP